jgi:hypothetical protein
MRRRCAGAVFALGLLVSLTAMPVSPSSANEGYEPLSLAGVGDLVVDTVHGQEFVSGGVADDTVVVADPEGRVVHRIQGLPSASRMVLSSDSSTLYVAEFWADAIAAVDTRTFQIIHTFSTGGAIRPFSLAFTAGTLWYSGFDDSVTESPPVIGAFDPVNGTHYPRLWNYGHEEIPILTSSPAAEGKLLALATASLTVFDATGGPEPTLSIHAQDAGINSRQTAFTPDGSDLVISGGYHAGSTLLRLDDLSELGTFSPQGQLAVRSDGLVASARNEQYDSDLSYWSPTDTSVSDTVDFGGMEGPGMSNQIQELAFGTQDLYVVTTASGPDELPVLRVLHPLTTPPVQITISTDKAVYTYGDRVRVTAHVSPGFANRMILFSASMQANPAVIGGGVFDSGYVDADGNFTADTVVGETIQITALAPGDRYGDPSGAASTTVTIPVAPQVQQQVDGGYASRYSYRLVHHNVRPSVAIAVKGAPHPGACMSVRVQKRSHGAWHIARTIRCTQLSSAGKSLVRLNRHSAGVRMRVRSSWAGDTHNAPATGTWRYFRFTH